MKKNKWITKNRQTIKFVILGVFLWIITSISVEYFIGNYKTTENLTANQQKLAIMNKQTPQEYYNQHKQQLLKNIAKQKKYLK